VAGFLMSECWFLWALILNFPKGGLPSINRAKNIAGPLMFSLFWNLGGEGF